MAELVVIELLETIGEQVGSEICETIVGAPDIDSQIKNLQDLKNIIEATLVDADSSQVSSHSQLVLLEKLELGLAKLSDFQDAEAVNFNKEARLFFSNPNQIVSSLKDARKIKGITGELNRTLSTDMVIGRDGDGVKVAGGSDVENDLESGSDSESDSSLSELINVFQKPETDIVSTSSIQPNMYVDGLAHLGFLSASVAWEWLRGQVGDVIDSPEIKPFAQQVVAN